jgi:hypothetical protein
MQSVSEKFVFCSSNNSITRRTSAVSENAIGKTTVRVVSPIEYGHVLSLDELFYVFLLR